MSSGLVRSIMICSSTLLATGRFEVLVTEELKHVVNRKEQAARRFISFSFRE